MRKLAIALAAAVSLCAVTMSTGAMAFGHGGGGGGGHGGGGFGGGGHFGGGGFGGGGHFGGGGFGGGGHFGGFSHGPGAFSHGVPGGASVNRGVGNRSFVNRGNRSFATTPGGAGHVGRARGNFAGHRVVGHGHYAWIGHHRVRGRRLHGFIPGYGYGDYWYYDDCWVWTAYGWVDMCGYFDDD